MSGDTSGATDRRPVVLGPGEGRAYPMGRLSAVFKADGDETARGYSISEWWLEPHTEGPGAHSHPEDDVFYVIAGTMSVLVDTEWVDADAGSFVLVPANMTHAFENRGSSRAGVLNISAPGTFEEHMPEISRWFAKHPARDTRDAYLEEHVRAFNTAVDEGRWDDFVARFADDAVLEFVGPPVGPFVGRGAIYDAYSQHPPDDRIELNGPATLDGDQLVAPYRWQATGATGSMRLDVRDGRLARLVIAFDAPAS